VIAATLLSSCTKDFTEINTDPNNVPAATPQQLLAPALVGVMTLQYASQPQFQQ
jgi:hypothetical protein